MDPTLLGLVLDTSVLVAAERRGLTVERLLENVRSKAGELEIAVSRATAEDVRQRRRTFIQDLKNAVPVHPITERTSEIIGRVGAEQAAKGITVPLGDLLIGASALEQGYGVGTGNLRHFQLIPGLTVVHL